MSTLNQSKSSCLTSNQLKFLNESFGLIDVSQRNIEKSIWLPHLLVHEQCEKLLNQLTPVINSPSIKVTASLLTKRYAFLATSSSLYAMSVFNAGIDMSPNNCFLDFSYEDKLWRSKMPILNNDVSQPLSHEVRTQWRDEVIKILFADHIAPLLQVIHDVTKLRPHILWENIAVRVFSLYEKKISVSCPAIAKRVCNDYNYLLHEAEPSIFGINYNPIKRYNFDKTRVTYQDLPIRFRRYCCYYYKATAPEEYCSSCPIVLARYNKNNS